MSKRRSQRKPSPGKTNPKGAAADEQPAQALVSKMAPPRRQCGQHIEDPSPPAHECGQQKSRPSLEERDLPPGQPAVEAEIRVATPCASQPSEEMEAPKGTVDESPNSSPMAYTHVLTPPRGSSDSAGHYLDHPPLNGKSNGLYSQPGNGPIIAPSKGLPLDQVKNASGENPGHTAQIQGHNSPQGPTYASMLAQPVPSAPNRNLARFAFTPKSSSGGSSEAYIPTHSSRPSLDARHTAPTDLSCPGPVDRPIHLTREVQSPDLPPSPPHRCLPLSPPHRSCSSSPVVYSPDGSMTGSPQLSLLSPLPQFTAHNTSISLTGTPLNQERLSSLPSTLSPNYQSHHLTPILDHYFNTLMQSIPSRQDFDSLISRVETVMKRELDVIKERVASSDLRVQALESSVASGEVRFHTVETQQMQQQRQLMQFQLHLDDLENRHRRNNLRIRGIPESTSGDELRHVVTGLLNMLLDRDPTTPIEMDRVHRALGPIPTDPQRSRDILCHIHY